MTNDKISRIKTLVEYLSQACIAYYNEDKPIMSDKQYDELYDELEQLEKETDFVLSGSPTQKVQGYILKGLEKQKHSKPMLSAAKTKDVNEIVKFLGDKDFYCSYKLDGLTMVTIYEKGELKTVLTRGSGEYGEIVTEQAKMISNLPKQINYKERLELRGECVVSWENFEDVNKKLKEPFSHPRNMAAGSLRNLDTNMAKERKLEFIVFECVTDIGIDSKLETLIKLREIGFDVVLKAKPIKTESINGAVERIVRLMTADKSKYPVDGLIFEIDSKELSESLGATSHHENSRYALKWADETYETVFRNIEWTTTRSGVINPTAVFDSVDIQGSQVSRATLHNLSFIEELQLGAGDIIEVYKANMIIPKIHDNQTRSNTWSYPEYCPCCSHKTVVHNNNGSKTLHCINSECSAKFISKLTNFVSKNGMDIKGLSESTLEALVDYGYVNEFVDLYLLKDCKEQLSTLPRMGAKSIKKLIDAIEVSRNVTLDKFLAALGIPLIGKSTARDIANYCGQSVYKFIYIVEGNVSEFNTIDGVGDAAICSLMEWWKDNEKMFKELISELNIIEPKEDDEVIVKEDQVLAGMIFVVTGSVYYFANRAALQSKIESLGGKVSGSVSKNTFALINNDKDSSSSKNKKAKDLGIKIWSENDFLEYIGEK